MSNELSKAIKKKTDAQFRTMGEDRTPSISEGAGGDVIIVDPGQYTIPYVAGKNIHIGTSGNSKVINALMNVLAGQNITVGEPDPDTGAVTISSNIGGKAIDLSGLADGYVLKYDLAADKFILGEAAGISEIPQATETTLGGIKAAERTTESSEVKIDPATGKLYVNDTSEGGGSYTLPQATELELGGIRAKAKTTESSEVAIDGETGKLYAPSPGQATNGLPAGGSASQVLSKVDGTDYNTEWVDPPSGSGLPAGGPEGYFLKKNSATDGDVSWTSPPIVLNSPGGVDIEDFENPDFKFQTEILSGWVKATDGYNSLTCLRSPYGTNASDVRFTVNLATAGKLSFYYKSQMQLANYPSYSGHTLTIDGVSKQVFVNNVSSFTKYEVDISAGVHTIRLYKHARTHSSGFWIDDLTLPGNGQYDMEAIFQNPEKLLVVAPSGLNVGFLPQDNFIKTPETEGTAGQVLMTDGAGSRSWGDIVHPAPMVNTGTALPTADVTYRGQIFTVLGDVGVADTSYICQKDTTDTYIWTQI